METEGNGNSEVLNTTRLMQPQKIRSRPESNKTEEVV